VCPAPGGTKWLQDGRCNGGGFVLPYQGILPALGLALEEVVLMLIQQVLGIIEGFFEPPEPCLQLAPVGALLSRLNHQVKLWQDGGF